MGWSARFSGMAESTEVARCREIYLLNHVNYMNHIVTLSEGLTVSPSSGYGFDRLRVSMARRGQHLLTLVLDPGRPSAFLPAALFNQKGVNSEGIWLGMETFNLKGCLEFYLLNHNGRFNCRSDRFL